MRKSVRNDVYAEARVVDVVNGKRDSIESDRTLRRDEGREGSRGLDQESGAVAVGFAVDDLRPSIDM